MAKSMAAHLRHALKVAAEVMGLADLSARDFIACHVDYRGLVFQLTAPAAAALFSALGLSRHRLNVTTSKGAFHLSFAALGAKWEAVLLTDEARSEMWREILDAPPARIEHQPPRLTVREEEPVLSE